MKSAAPIANSIARKFDQMIANAPEEQSELAGDNHSFRIVRRDKSERPFTSKISEASQHSKASQFSNVLNTEVCSSVPSVVCSSVSSITSVSSVPSIYTWEELALAAQAEEEAKRSLPTQIRTWYDKWIDSVFKADVETWQIQISDMIGKHLMHATGEKNTLALVTAFHDLNASKFASIPREGFIARAEKIMVQELDSWIEALSSGEAAYYRQLPVPHQEAFRICRSLALRALDKEGASTFFLGSHELGKRISISDREAAAILNKSPFLRCVEKGKTWQLGTKPRASLWQWIYPLEAAAKSGVEKSTCPL
jgi:hypothetical protein